MNFSFSEEEQMLSEAARRLIGAHYGFERRQRIRASAEGWSREMWTQLGALGLLAINIPEEDGGYGAGPISTMLACNAVGEGLLLEPFLSSAVVATRTIAQMGSREQRTRWLPEMATGERISVLAHEEAEDSIDLLNIRTNATEIPGGWEINGRKSLIYHAPMANLLLITARTDGELGLFAVAADTPGVNQLPDITLDDQRACDLLLENVRVPAQARLGGDARETLEAVLDYGLAALCAEAIGAMERLLQTTITYSRSRKQFGVPIGSFQALQHRMAEMLMHLEQARSMSYLAATRCTDPDSRSRRAALSAAKTLMGKAARYIGQQAVQLHGGMGMTDELDVSHYFKRLLAFELRCGTTGRHLEIYRRGMVFARARGGG